MIEPQDKVAKIIALRSKYQVLKQEKISLIDSFRASDEVSQELRKKASEAARIHDLTIGHLSGTNETKQNTNKSSVLKSSDNQSIVYAERKLGIKHSFAELDKLVKSKEKEVDLYESKLSSLERQITKAQRNLSAFPSRYQESAADIQKKLLLTMREKSDLESELCELEGSGDELLGQLRSELALVYREVGDLGDEYRECLSRIDSLNRRSTQKRMITQPMIGRVKRLQEELVGSWGEEALLMAAFEVLGENQMLNTSLIDMVITDFVSVQHKPDSSVLQNIIQEVGLKDKEHVDLSQLKQILGKLGIRKNEN